MMKMILRALIDLIHLLMSPLLLTGSNKKERPQEGLRLESNLEMACQYNVIFKTSLEKRVISWQGYNFIYSL